MGFFDTVKAAANSPNLNAEELKQKMDQDKAALQRAADNVEGATVDTIKFFNKHRLDEENLVAALTLVRDHAILTDKRLLFVSGSIIKSNRRSVVTSIPFSKIVAVGFEGGMLTKEIEIHVSGQSFEISSVAGQDTAGFFKRLNDAVLLAS